MKFNTSRYLILFLLTFPLYAANLIDISSSRFFTDKTTLAVNSPKTYPIKFDSITSDQILAILVSSSPEAQLQLEVIRADKGASWKGSLVEDKSISVCMIQSEELKGASKLDIVVKCSKECEIAVSVKIALEFESGLSESYDFQAADYPMAFLLKAKIPQTIKFDDIIVDAISHSPDVKDAKLSLYVNAGKTQPAIPTTSKYQWASSKINDQTFKLSLENKKTINSGDTIRILAIAPSRIIWVLRCFALNNHYRQIFLYQNILEHLTSSSELFYHLNLQLQSPQDTYSSISLRMNRPSGTCTMLISGKPDFQDEKSVMVISALSHNTQLTLTPAKRQQAKIDKNVYIKIMVPDEAIFSFQISTYHMKFQTIYDGAMLMVPVSGDEIRHVLYELREAENGLATFDIFISAPPDAIDFEVDRCKSMETGITRKENSQQEDEDQIESSYECLQKNQTDMKQKISGRYHEYRGFHFYRFSYNISQCNKVEQIYLCDFQVGVWKLPNYTRQSVDFQIQITKSGSVKNIYQGYPTKALISTGQQAKFNFSLNSIKNVKEVRFFLTIFSGQCTMFVTHGNDNIIGDSISITDNIGYNYPITVRGYQQSYFMLTALVVRHSKNANKYKQEIGTALLIEGVANTFTISEGSYKTLRFGINLPSTTDFMLSIIGLEGSFWSEIVAVHRNQSLIGVPIPLYTSITPINPKLILFSKDNQFIVSVHSIVQPSTFTIMYHLANSTKSCSTFKIGKPIVLKPNNQSSHCFNFHIAKLEQLEIILDTETPIKKIQVVAKIQSNKIIIDDSYTKISKKDILKQCPNIVSKESDVETCNLLLTFGKVTKQLNIAVQYTSTEIQLFDGLVQRTKNVLSMNVGRHFYFSISNDRSVSVFVTSRTHTDYLVVATLKNWTQYENEANPFPKNNDTENVFVSTTTQTGITALVIPSNKVKSSSCTSCVLLISVFQKDSEKQADFKIEASQSLNKLQFGISKLGYVQRGAEITYEFTNQANSQAVLALNSLHQDCSRMYIYTRDPITQQLSKAISETNHAILQKSLKQKNYVVKVNGNSSSCAYQISLSKTTKRIYEVLAGVPFNLFLDKKQTSYLLYFHTRNQSFRVMCTTQSPQFYLQAQPLNTNQTSSDYGRYFNKQHFLFSMQLSSKLLTIPQNHPKFCFSCYYLIRIQPGKKPSNYSILIHTHQASVALRSNKMLHETITADDYEDYTYFSTTSFGIRFNVTDGSARVSVYRGRNRREVVKAVGIVGEGRVEVEAPRRRRSEVVGFDSENQYVVKVQAVKGKTLVFYLEIEGKVQGNNALVVGMPMEISIKDQTCQTFVATENSTNLTLFLVSSQSLADVKSRIYSIEGGKRTEVESKQHKSINEFTFELPQKRQYSFCFTNTKAITANLLLLDNESSLMAVGKESQSTDKYGIRKIQVQKEGWLTLQAFQCGQQLQIAGSTSISDLIDNSQETIFDYSNSAHHFIQHAKVQPGNYYVYAINNGQQEQVYFANKATFSQLEQSPYDSFEQLADSLIVNNAQSDVLSVQLKKIKASSEKFKIESEKYVVYLTQSEADAVTGAQCGADHFNKQVTTDPASKDNAKILISIQQIDEHNLDLENLYVSAVCTLKVKIDDTNTQQLIFIYNPINVNQTKVGIFNNKSVAYIGILFAVIVSILVILILKRRSDRISLSRKKLAQQQAIPNTMNTEPVLVTSNMIKVGQTSGVTSMAQINKDFHQN